MIKKLLLCLLTLCPACSLIPGPWHDYYSSRAYNRRFAVKHLSKRDSINCPSDTQYQFYATTDVICCYSCDPGYFAKTVGCTRADPKTNCERCTEGKEYMDLPNHKTKCLRCSDCDRQLGLEVETNCTIKQNTKCKCQPGYFCSSKRCQHCDPCDKCEGATVLEECTETENTKCSIGAQWWQWALPLFLIGVAVTAIVIWKRCRNKQKNDGKDTNIGEELLRYPDIDLTPYISDIAEEMKLREVRKLVRKLSVSPTRIEEVMLNNNNDTYEQKIKLLECWYQEKGKKDAYVTLITTLKKLGFCATADKIEQKIRHGLDNHC